jgi:hypothetical protein
MLLMRGKLNRSEGSARNWSAASFAGQGTWVLGMLAVSRELAGTPAVEVVVGRRQVTGQGRRARTRRTCSSSALAMVAEDDQVWIRGMFVPRGGGWPGLQRWRP